jgi:hypothetical protein
MVYGTVQSDTEDGGSTSLRNVDKLQTDYMASHPRRYVLFEFVFSRTGLSHLRKWYIRKQVILPYLYQMPLLKSSQDLMLYSLSDTDSVVK